MRHRWIAQQKVTTFAKTTVGNVENARREIELQKRTIAFRIVAYSHVHFH